MVDHSVTVSPRERCRVSLLSRAVMRESMDLCCRRSKYPFHSAKSENPVAWGSSELGLGPALENLGSLCPRADSRPLGQKVAGEGMGGLSPQEGMSNKNSLQSAFTGMISLGLMTPGC